MPIENIDEEMQNDKIVVQNKDVFAHGNIVVAGFLVKNPLYDCKLQLIGFTDHYPTEQEKTQVVGMRYHQVNSYPYYNIYLKMVIDLKQNQHKNFVEVNATESRYNYYFYENIADKFAGHYSDRMYAVCKYREDGIIKHAFFNLHEITPDI
jgi:hypothetical protein